MKAFTVVEHLNVLEAGRTHLRPCFEAHTMHPLILEAIEPALGRGVVPAIPFSAHRAGHAVVGELVLEGRARVLATPVGMVQQARRRLSPEPRHGQRIGHNVRRHARFQRPADHFTVEQVEHDSQVQPALIRPQVGDVGAPDLVGRRRREVPVQQILGDRQTMPGIRRDLVAPFMPGMDRTIGV